MHQLYGDLPMPYVSVLVTQGALVAHRYTYEPPRYRTPQFRRTFIPISVSLLNYLADSMFDVGTGGFQEQGQ